MAEEKSISEYEAQIGALENELQQRLDEEQGYVRFSADCIGVALFMGNGKSFYIDESSPAQLPFEMTPTQRSVALARLKAAVQQISMLGTYTGGTRP